MKCTLNYSTQNSERVIYSTNLFLTKSQLCLLHDMNSEYSTCPFNYLSRPSCIIKSPPCFRFNQLVGKSSIHHQHKGLTAMALFNSDVHSNSHLYNT